MIIISISIRGGSLPPLGETFALNFCEQQRETRQATTLGNVLKHTYIMGPTFHFEDNCEKVVKLKLGSIFGTGSSPELGKPGLPEGGDAITAEARFDHTQRLVSPDCTVEISYTVTQRLVSPVSTALCLSWHCTEYILQK